MTTTRDRIISTAAALLERQGYHATGLNQIVAESQSPKGSLYHYFPRGKEEIAAEAVEEAGRTIAQRIREVLALRADPADAVRLFVEALAEYVESVGCRGGSPITIVALETAGESERLTSVCAEAYASWEAEFAAKLAAADIAPERAASLATLINSTIEGAAILSRTKHDAEPLRRVAAELHAIIRAATPVGQ